MKQLSNLSKIIDIIMENSPSNIEYIISLEVHFSRDTYNPILKIKYYNKNKECKFFKKEIK